MEFINEFVCFGHQDVDITESVDVLEITSPFVVINDGVPDTYIGGINTGIENDKSYLIFVINRSSNIITIKNNNLSTSEQYQIETITGLDYSLNMNSFCILVKTSGKFLLK